VVSDCRNLNKREIVSFPIPGSMEDEHRERLSELIRDLMHDYKRNAIERTVNYEGVGNVTVQYFNFRPSKPIIDCIDRVLAPYYGLTSEESDFIINYDLKYRLGQDYANSVDEE
jgi:hypothetical protein